MSHDPMRPARRPSLAPCPSDPSIPSTGADQTPPTVWPLLEGVRGRARFSADGSYRYSLERRWDARLPCFTFVLLNPSQASAHGDDPTTRKLHRICLANGGGAYILVNLFALVDTHQSGLHLETAVGETHGENDRSIRRAVSRSDRVVVGWGTGGGTAFRIGERRRAVHRRACTVWPILARHELWCVGCNRAGSPRHPGRGVRNDVLLRPFIPMDYP